MLYILLVQPTEDGGALDWFECDLHHVAVVTLNDSALQAMALCSRMRCTNAR
jgi:hypothetical protein